MTRSELFALIGGIYFVLFGLVPKTIYRKGTAKPDPHQTRVRLAYVGIGLALLLLWYSQHLQLKYGVTFP